MTKIYAYAIGALSLIIFVGIGAWYVHDLRAAVATARANQTIAEANVGTCASALKQADHATADAVAQSKLYHDQAQAAIEAATTKKGKNTAEGTVFATNIITSAKTTDCRSVLEATLCPALSAY